ncbi:MAG: DUF58 domain-containing protein [Phycisphaeraceae bacterium]|nr:DUF58 domain-containing protein [Phycisphaeraceae bacterium]
MAETPGATRAEGKSDGRAETGARASSAAAAGRLPEADAQLYLHPQTLARLGSLELRAKMIVEGVMSGAHKSPFQGFSVEFAQHRPYVPGDDLRHLDWKVYGRSDKLHLKQYQQETNLDLVVMVDSSGSMDFGSRSFGEASGAGRTASPDGRAYWSKFDHATAVGAALSYMALRQGDRVGLVVFADEVRAMLKRSSAMSTWRQIVGALSTQPVDRPTNFGRVVDQTLAKLTNRCLIALVSDLFIDPEEYRSALARVRHRRHDMIVMQVIDEQERTLDLNQVAPFEGLEGEPRLRVDPRAIRSAYREIFAEHLETIERITRSLGFDYQRVNTHDWLGPPMAAFMSRRNAQIKRSKFG